MLLNRLIFELANIAFHLNQELNKFELLFYLDKRETKSRIDAK